MKVICMTNHWIKANEDPLPSPEFGKIYTVADEIRTDRDAFGNRVKLRVYYRLNEMNPKSAFAAENFAEISHLDEKEMIRDYKPQTQVL